MNSYENELKTLVNTGAGTGNTKSRNDAIHPPANHFESLTDSKLKDPSFSISQTIGKNTKSNFFSAKNRK